MHRSRSSAFVCSPPGRCLCWECKLRWSNLRNRCRQQSPRRWGRSGAPANRNHGFVGRTAAGSIAASQTGITRRHVIVHAPRRFEHLKRWYLHDGVLALDVVDRLQPARACSFGAAVDTARFALKRNVTTVLRGCTRAWYYQYQSACWCTRLRNFGAAERIAGFRRQSLLRLKCRVGGLKKVRGMSFRGAVWGGGRPCREDRCWANHPHRMNNSRMI